MLHVRLSLCLLKYLLTYLRLGESRKFIKDKTKVASRVNSYLLWLIVVGI